MTRKKENRNMDCHACGADWDCRRPPACRLESDVRPFRRSNRGSARPRRRRPSGCTSIIAIAKTGRRPRAFRCALYDVLSGDMLKI